MEQSIMRSRMLCSSLTLWAAVALPLRAQSNFGLIGGLSSATVAFDPPVTPSPTSRSGLAAGLYAVTRLGRGLGLESDLMFVQKGFQEGGSSTGLAHKSGYVELPMLLRLSSNAGSMRVFGVAGPEVALRVSCTEEVTALGATQSRDCANGDGSEDVKRFDGGVMFGAGVGVRRASVSVRYDLGLANIVNSSSDLTGKHRTLLVLLAVGL
jgi:hypothetical protein